MFIPGPAEESTVPVPAWHIPVLPLAIENKAQGRFRAFSVIFRFQVCERVDTILKMSMPWDTMIGVSRRNWAGNPNSMSTVAEYNEMYKGKDHITIPYVADADIVAKAVASMKG